MRQWYIYALTDPRTFQIRYVGWSFNPVGRLAAHCRRSKTENTHKAHWIKNVITSGYEPGLLIVESGSNTSGWAGAEKRWVAHYRVLGCPLTNATEGGEGTPGMIVSLETRAKMSAAHRDKKRSAESIARSAEGLRGRKKTAEHVAKMAEAFKGKIPWAATLAAARKVRGSKQSAEHVEARISKLRGRIIHDQRKKQHVVDGATAWECSGCRVIKIEAEFPKSKAAWNGLMPICKICHADRQKKYRGCQRPVAA